MVAGVEDQFLGAISRGLITLGRRPLRAGRIREAIRQRRVVFVGRQQTAHKLPVILRREFALSRERVGEQPRLLRDSVWSGSGLQLVSGGRARAERGE